MFSNLKFKVKNTIEVVLILKRYETKYVLKLAFLKFNNVNITFKYCSFTSTPFTIFSRTISHSNEKVTSTNPQK